jgi:ATP-dependent Clp protease ATP-binding subunit ClpA
VHYTVEAKRILEAATNLAASRGHSYIGADHLGVALLSSRDTEAVSALKRLEVPLVELRRALSRALPARGHHRGTRPMSPRLRKLLQDASRLAAARDAGPIGTEDLLMALLRSDGPTREEMASAIVRAANGTAYSCCVAADVLRAVGDVFRDRESYSDRPKA